MLLYKYNRSSYLGNRYPELSQKLQSADWDSNKTDMVGPAHQS